jgi:hypothetical protein
MEPGTNPDGTNPVEPNEVEPNEADGLMDVGEVATVDAAPRPAFAWGKFFGYLGSVVVVAMLGGIAAAGYWGWTPLQDRTREVVDVPITRIEFEWPALGASRASAKSAGVGSSSMPPPGQVQEVSKADVGGKPKAAKKAKPETKPESKPAEPSLPWSARESTTWLPEQFQEMLIDRARAALGATPDPMSRGPLVAVADTLEASGWFRGRPMVERRAGGVLRVSGAWRVPAAVVRTGGKDHLLSWDGTPMPVEYAVEQSKLPAVMGVVAPPPVNAKGRDYSAVWPGEEMDAAMELLRTLAVEPWYGQVSGVDVSGYRENRRLTIVTKVGGVSGRVVWGGRASKPLVGEASTKAKIARLGTINRTFGRIDAGLDGSTRALEIYWGQGPLVLNVSATNTGALVEVPTP